jgi:hypothetical protein
MARYIDADKLLENLKLQYGEDLGWQCTINMSDVGMMIEDAPTADVVEVKHGEWIKPQFVGRRGFYGLKDCACGICKKEYAIEESCDFLNYCPFCGAKMDGGGKE